MRTITRKIKVAKFKELNEEQKKKVLDKQRDINTDYDWSADLINEYREDLEALGFSNVEINFTGFACQGDGASFTGNFAIPNKRQAKKRLESFKERCGIEKFVTLAEKLLDNQFTKEDKEEGVNIYRINSRYYHENTIKSDCDFVDEWAREYSKVIYRSLEKQEEYLTSDDAVKETIEANDYEFNVDTLKIERAA